MAVAVTEVRVEYRCGCRGSVDLTTEAAGFISPRWLTEHHDTRCPEHRGPVARILFVRRV